MFLVSKDAFSLLQKRQWHISILFLAEGNDFCPDKVAKVNLKTSCSQAEKIKLNG